MDDFDENDLDLDLLSDDRANEDFLSWLLVNADTIDPAAPDSAESLLARPLSPMRDLGDLSQLTGSFTQGSLSPIPLFSSQQEQPLAAATGAAATGAAAAAAAAAAGGAQPPEHRKRPDTFASRAAALAATTHAASSGFTAHPAAAAAAAAAAVPAHDVPAAMAAPVPQTAVAAMPRSTSTQKLLPMPSGTFPMSMMNFPMLQAAAGNLQMQLGALPMFSAMPAQLQAMMAKMPMLSGYLPGAGTAAAPAAAVAAAAAATPAAELDAIPAVVLGGSAVGTKAEPRGGAQAAAAAAGFYSSVTASSGAPAAPAVSAAPAAISASAAAAVAAGRPRKYSADSTGLGRSAAAASDPMMPPAPPTDGRKRKRMHVDELEAAVVALAEENERLTLHVANVQDKARAIEQRKAEMEAEIGAQLAAVQAADSKHSPHHSRGKASGKSAASRAASEAPLIAALAKFKDLYADYGDQRRREIQFHLGQLESLILPTQTTKMSLWTLEQDANFYRNRRKGTLSHILTSELGVSEDQIARIQERRARIQVSAIVTAMPSTLCCVSYGAAAALLVLISVLVGSSVSAMKIVV
jgi:hypothetical protein